MTEPGLALMGDEQIVYVIMAILYFVGQVVSAVLKKKRANESATPARSNARIAAAARCCASGTMVSG